MLFLKNYIGFWGDFIELIEFEVNLKIFKFIVFFIIFVVKKNFYKRRVIIKVCKF